MKCDNCRTDNYNTCEHLGFIGEVRSGCFYKYIVIRQDMLIRVALLRRLETDRSCRATGGSAKQLQADRLSAGGLHRPDQRGPHRTFDDRDGQGITAVDLPRLD